MQKKKLEAQVSQIKRELDSSQVQKRDLEGCLQIRKFEQEIERCDTPPRHPCRYMPACLSLTLPSSAFNLYSLQYRSIREEVSDVKRQMSSTEFSGARSGAQKVQDEIRNKGQQKAGTEGRNRGFNDQVIMYL